MAAERRLRAQLRGLDPTSSSTLSAQGVARARRRPGHSSSGGPVAAKGLPYTDSGHERHTLDVYHAQPSGPARPIIFYIHGGGWEGGDASMVTGSGYEDRAGPNPWGKPEWAVEQGYVFVSTNYRLLKYGSWAGEMTADVDVRIGTMAEDCAKAMRWTHDNAAEFGGDGKNMIVMGHSAGAQLAALLCTDARLLERQGLDLGEVVSGCIPIDGDTSATPPLLGPLFSAARTAHPNRGRLHARQVRRARRHRGRLQPRDEVRRAAGAAGALARAARGARQGHPPYAAAAHLREI